MNWRIPGLIIIFFIVSFVLMGAAMAKEGSGGSATGTEQAEATPTEPTGEPVKESYLSNLSTSEGDLSLIIKLHEDGEDSPFFNRYQDGFAGHPVYINEIAGRAWLSQAEIFRYEISHTWNSSQGGSFEWRRPNEVRVWGAYNNYDHFEMPLADPGGRTDFGIGAEAYRLSGNDFQVNYTYREHRMADPGETSAGREWDTNDIALNYAFRMSDWNGALEFRNRSYDGRAANNNDVTHTTGVLRASRQFGQDGFVEGSLLYNRSDVDRANGMTSVRLGGYARLMNAFGVDRLNLTGRLGWNDRSSGPSRLHPAGNLFDIDLEGRWQACPQFNMYGSWSRNRAAVSHPDEVAILEFRGDPDRTVPDQGRILAGIVSTDRCNLGWRWKLSETVDATADWTWVDRNGLENTDFVTVNSPPLLWDSETRSVYELRYRPDIGWRIGQGDWVLRYEKENRSNGYRANTADDERLSIDWTGMVDENLWVYLGGGFLRTDSINPELDANDQRGHEFGGGWEWDLGSGWNMFGDYWTYDVSGASGYDQRNYGAGLKYDLDEFWTWSVQYDRIRGEFDQTADLDYTVNQVLLNITCRW